MSDPEEVVAVWTREGGLSSLKGEAGATALTLNCSWISEAMLYYKAQPLLCNCVCV